MSSLRCQFMSWDGYGCAFLGYHSDCAAHGLQVCLRDTDLTGETVCSRSQEIIAPQLVTPEADLCYVQTFMIIAVISLPAVGYHLPVLPRQRAADPPRPSFPQGPAPSWSRLPPAPLQSSWRWGHRWRLSGDSHIPKHSHVISHFTPSFDFYKHPFLPNVIRHVSRGKSQSSGSLNEQIPKVNSTKYIPPLSFNTQKKTELITLPNPSL